MDEPQEPKMTPFDQMINDDNLQLLKASIPYAPLKLQGFLSVLAKLQELQHAFHLSARPPAMHMMSQEPPAALPEMLQDIGQYTNGSMRETFEGISSALSMIQMMQSLQQMESQIQPNQEGDPEYGRMDE